MLYLVCPTCNEHLGNRQIIFDKQIDNIMNSDEDDSVKEKLKSDLVNNLGLDNYCCKMRIITFKRLVEIIK